MEMLSEPEEADRDQRHEQNENARDESDKRIDHLNIKIHHSPRELGSIRPIRGSGDQA
jgi:hypothetical protein